MQFTKFLPNQGGRTKVLSGFVQRRSTMLFLMRVSVFYVALISGSIQLSLASSTSGQKLDETYVTVELNHESLQTLFEKIEKQTNLLFTFPEGVKSYSALTLASGRRSVKETLDMVLKDTPVTYKQINGNLVAVFVGEGEKHSLEKENDKIMSALIMVTGTVKDATTQEALAGVNVIVKGTTQGTTTDIDGKFSIETTDNDLLVFTFIGFKSYETQVNGRSILDIFLETDVTALQEVEVNAGYWKVNEKELTGNITRVTQEDIQKQPVANPIQALQGRMPGVYIEQQTGLPGGNFNIQIRGRNSLRNNGNDPLYVIDGVPFSSSPLNSNAAIISAVRFTSPLNGINPSDIESIEVLKDADATAIYGSRGANGVVLITTKRAKAGKTTFDVSAYTGVGKITRKMDLLNTQQYVEMRKETFKNDGFPISGFLARDLLEWDTTRYTDWQKKLVGGSATTTNAQASITGGDANTQFLMGFGYYRETTVFPGDFGYQKGSGHFNINHTTRDQKFNISLSTSYVIDKNNLLQADLTTQALTLPPNAPSLYDDEGNLNWQNGTWINPYSELLKKYDAKTDNFISNLVLSYNLTKDLRFKSSLGYNSQKMTEVSLEPIASQDPAYGPTGRSRFGNTENKNWIVEPQLIYSKTIGKGELNALIGTTFQQNTRNGQGIIGSGYESDGLLENIQAAPNISLYSSYSKYKYNAVFGRVNYNFLDRYIINLTGRRDGSSRFGPGKKFANFGAIGFAWLFYNEEFIKNNFPLLSYGKIRGSYGITGSDQIGDYGFLDTYSTTSRPYQGKTGLKPTRLVNPDYRWETNKKIEAAIELGFLNDRILIEASYYRNRSSNQLVGYPLPLMTGFSSVQFNLPATVQNSGWEFQLNTINVKGNVFSWTSSLNASIPRNKLIEYPNLAGSSYADTYVVGKSLYIQKTFHTLDVDPTTGFYNIEDSNESGDVSFDDRVYISEASQKFYGGFQNTFKYKGFQLDLLFQFVKQTGTNYLSVFPSPGYLTNQPTVVLNRWQKPGDITDIQKYTLFFDTSFNNFSQSDRVFSDASFIRLKNLSFSWTLPAVVSNRLKLESVRIFLQGQNLLTITKYVGMDPENKTGNLPPLKTLAGGLQLKF